MHVVNVRTKKFTHYSLSSVLWLCAYGNGCVQQVPGGIKVQHKMDVVLDYADRYFFTPYIYPASWPEENVFRQLLSLNIISDAGGALLYLITATFSYLFIFDKRHLKHPHILEAGWVYVIYFFQFQIFLFEWSFIKS